MAGEGKADSSASETSVEIVVIVRPVKVIGMLLSAFALLLMVLAVAATAWIEANRVREGLWERCFYRQNETDMVDCEENPPRDWLRACQGLCMLAMTLTFVGVVIVSIGLRGDHAPRKTRLYLVAVVAWLAAVFFQAIALIVFPVKFLEEMADKSVVQWRFGWSYGLSWTASLCVAAGAGLVFFDRRAVEIEEREVTIEKEGLEEEEQATEAM
ncbi:hypothetical protein ACOMHN_033881 [Nucella lapillus]